MTLDSLYGLVVQKEVNVAGTRFNLSFHKVGDILPLFY